MLARFPVSVWPRLIGIGPPNIPTPVSGTPCGLPGALSVICTDALRGPGAMGVNVRLRRQLSPAAREPPSRGQVVAAWNAKSSRWPPVIVMPEMLSTAVPVLVSVTSWGGLVVPTGCWPKSKLGGERFTAGPIPAGMTVSVACTGAFGVAVTVATARALTGEVLAVNVAVLLPERTVTEAGTVTTEVLLLRRTTAPPLGAGAVSVTVPVED